MKLPKSFTTVTPFSRLIALILFVLLPFVGFYTGVLYQRSITPPQQLITISPVTPINTPLVAAPSLAPSVVPTPASKLFSKGKYIFTHPELKYSVVYPITWTGGEIAANNYGKAISDFTIFSPSYQLDEFGRDLAQGSVIYIFARATTDTSIDTYHSVGLEVGTNIKYFTFSSSKAVQYDYSYEGWMATDTVFVKNGILYTIKLRYSTTAEKQKQWATYQQLLQSFKVAN